VTKPNCDDKALAKKRKAKNKGKGKKQAKKKEKKDSSSGEDDGKLLEKFKRFHSSQMLIPR
jgi:hypothetical protein